MKGSMNLPPHYEIEIFKFFLFWALTKQTESDPIGPPKILKGWLHGPAKEVTMGIYKRPDSKKWWISYYHNGERVREGVSTNKREAEKVLMQRLTAINENKHPVLQKRKNKKIKLAAFAEKYITDYSKPNKKSYEYEDILIITVREGVDKHYRGNS